MYNVSYLNMGATGKRKARKQPEVTENTIGPFVEIFLDLCHQEIKAGRDLDTDMDLFRSRVQDCCNDRTAMIQHLYENIEDYPLMSGMLEKLCKNTYHVRSKAIKQGRDPDEAVRINTLHRAVCKNYISCIVARLHSQHRKPLQTLLLSLQAFRTLS